jgi:uncharacterized oligopeptide transporter (OPT) family protein
MSTPLKIFLILLTAIFGFAAGMGLFSSITAGVMVAVLLGGFASWILWRFPIIQIEKSAEPSSNVGLLIMSENS